MRLIKNYICFGCLIFLFGTADYAQQVADTSFVFPIYQAAYNQHTGPTVMIDGAHNNFHTRESGFSPFARLLEQDGYKVKALESEIADPEILDDCRILVIANPLNKINIDNWTLPTPSAFTEKEILTLRKWVERGGRLLLIADHMPFAGAASKLGAAFGFEFVNGFAYTRQRAWPPSVFKLVNNTLLKSAITEGIKNYENIDSVATFTGSSFKSPAESNHILVFTKDNYSLMPDTAWQFNKNTTIKYLEGYDQGAVTDFGKGKIAVFGEAAMFTAQTVNGNVNVGINSNTAPQNAQFVLNLIHWLDGVTDYKGKMDKNYIKN